MYIIILILLLIILYILNKNKNEYYDFYTQCNSCNNKSYFECRNCENCATCATEMGDLYCIKGNELGPINDPESKIKYTIQENEKNNKDTIYCLKYNYGNIYPQYYHTYYSDNHELLDNTNDARFYPFLKTLDDKKNTDYYNKETNYKQIFHDDLEPEETISS